MVETHDSGDKFWQEFYEELLRQNSIASTQRSVTSMFEFLCWLEENFQPDAKLVLIVDDFDVLNQTSPSLRQQFLSMLLAARGFRQGYVRGLIAVGTFHLLKLTYSSRFPFHFSAKFKCPNFSEQQVVDLFEEFAEAQGLENWDERIARDIQQRTDGHAGLVCFCGKKIQQSNPRIDTYDRWINYASTMLPADVRAEYVPVQQALHTVLADSTVVTYLSSALSSAMLRSQFIEQIPPLLVGEGLLAELSIGGYEYRRISSPLIRALLLSAVSTMNIRDAPAEALPVHSSVAVYDVLKLCLKHFNANEMSRAPRWAWKEVRHPVTNSTRRVPLEFVYLAELMYILQRWLGDRCQIVCEADGPFLLLQGI